MCLSTVSVKCSRVSLFVTCQQQHRHVFFTMCKKVTLTQLHIPRAVPPSTTLFKTSIPLCSGSQPLSRPCAKFKTSLQWHLHTVAYEATGVFCNIFSLFALDSTLTQSNKLTLYKLLIPSILADAAPVWSSTSSSIYLRLQVTLHIEPIRVIFHQLKAKFFAHCPSQPNPLVQQIGNYTLVDLTNMYRKYKHKRPKPIQL